MQLRIQSPFQSLKHRRGTPPPPQLQLFRRPQSNSTQWGNIQTEEFNLSQTRHRGDIQIQVFYIYVRGCVMSHSFGKHATLKRQIIGRFNNFSPGCKKFKELFRVYCTFAEWANIQQVEEEAPNRCFTLRHIYVYCISIYCVCICFTRWHKLLTAAVSAEP